LNVRRFYQRLFAPLEKAYGPIDDDSLVAIIGFDAGGPLNFCTFHRARKNRPTTFVSCELAVRPEQRPSQAGRYELLATSSSEIWVRSILSGMGRMSLEARFDHGHTVDIGAWVKPRAPIQGVVLERACSARIEREPYCILRCIGVTRRELEFAQLRGTDELLGRLRAAKIYPETVLRRSSLKL
jgi:hypothetical protein